MTRRIYWSMRCPTSFYAGWTKSWGIRPGTRMGIRSRSLNSIAPGEQVVVEQIHDGDSELLRYLAENSITPGAVLAVVRPPVAGLVQVQVQDEQSEDQEVVPISVSSAADIRVSHAED